MPVFSSLNSLNDVVEKGISTLSKSIKLQLSSLNNSSNSVISTNSVSFDTLQISKIAALSVIGLYATWSLISSLKPRDKSLPPFVPHYLPFFGSMFSFGKDPVRFLLDCHQKYGEVFTFLLFGRTLTYVVGSEASDVFFNAKGSDVSAEAAYASLTVPVFGEGVLYGVPHEVMTEQKKMCKGAFTHESFEKYVPIIEKETFDYIQRWGNSSEVDLLESMSEITIMTASHCLLGEEIRGKLHEGFAKLYSDLDGGFTPLNYLFPNVPFPRNIKRDRAHVQIRNIFMDVIRRRREANDYSHVDLTQTLMDSSYKDGHKMSDKEISHLLIAVLLGGQHTSSTTATWIGFELSQAQSYVQQIREEVEHVTNHGPLTYNAIKELKVFDKVIKEILRIHPPLVQIMRLVVKDLTYKNLRIPAGNFICVSPTANHMLSSVFPNPEKFDPERFASAVEEDQQQQQFNGKFAYTPFGAGRHRCIGEQYAYMQLKTIWATIFRHYDIEAVQPIPHPSYTSLVVLPTHSSHLKFVKRS